MATEDSVFTEATIGYDASLDVMTNKNLKILIMLRSCGNHYNVTSNKNTRAAIMCAGMHEMTRFMINVMGIPEKTSHKTVFESSAGVGDLILTCAAGRGRLLASEFVMYVQIHGLSENKDTNVERWTKLKEKTMN